jgi:recombinational DNA repair protein RecR
MKDFVRLLSMNHADLVGHLIEEEYDISVTRDARGVNVGDEIDVEDVLSLNKAEG